MRHKLTIIEAICDNSLTNSNPGILGGTPIFVGSRMPMGILVIYWEASAVSTSFWLSILPYPESRQECLIALKRC